MKISKYIILSGCFLAVIAGCNDNLDIEPLSSVTPESICGRRNNWLHIRLITILRVRMRQVLLLQEGCWIHMEREILPKVHIF